MTTTRKPLRLATETLRFMALATVDTSRGRPCHTHHSCDGLPCTRSQDGCP